MKNATRLLAPTLILSLGLFLLPATASAAAPTCYGDEATIPGATAGSDVLYGTAGNDVIIGLGGDDEIYGGGGRDKICGDSGDDYVDGGASNDRMDGGTGDNFIWFFDEATGAVDVDLAAGVATGVGEDDFENFANVWGTQYDDIIKGDGASNIVFGDDGHDEIQGRGGADWLLGDAGLGAPGDDAIYGGSGFDYVSFAYSPSPITAYLQGPSPTYDPGEGYATGEGMDYLFDLEGIIGSTFPDNLYGGNGSNAFVGDPLDGGGYGDDSIYGEGGFDIMMYLFSPGPVTTDFDYNPDALKTGQPKAPHPADGWSTGGEGSDWLSSTEAVIGSEFDDTFIGDNKPNGFLGLGGNDTMYGYGKGDWPQGDAGNDWADGGRGKDVCKAETTKKCDTGTKSNLDGPMKNAAKAFRRH